MKFQNLTVENFLTIKSASVNLQDRGLQLIQGQNDDDSSASSNGAGKSSLVDAICWCLYGLTAREAKGDAVVNLGAKKDCKVSLELLCGTDTYRVTRHRKHTVGKNALVVELTSGIDLSKGTDAETQKVLERILGCSYEVFIGAVYSGQEAMPDLPKMKDRELKTLIEEAAGLQRIERAYELARARANTVKSKVAVLEAQTASCRADQARAEMSLEDVTVKHDQWELDRAGRLADTARVVEDAQESFAAARDTCEHLLPEKSFAVVEITRIDDELAKHKTLEAKALTAVKAVHAAEMAIDANLLKRLQAQVVLHEGQIANAATEIKKPCAECGTVLETMSVDEYVKHRTEHLNAAKLKLEEGKVTARKQVATLLALRETAKACREAIPDVSALTSERIVHNTVVASWVKADADFRRVKNDLAAVETQYLLRSTEPNIHASALTVCREQVASAVARLAAAESSLSTEKAALDIANAVVKVFGPAGVRAQILDHVTPFLNERTADYLSTLSDGEIQCVWTTLTRDSKGDLKEKFSLDVTHAKGGDSFVLLSGGEKRKVRLATALALQDLVASRATQPIDLFIGDELDDALDPAGLERLMVLLERKGRERGTVLIISHSDLKDWCDNVTTVKKTGLWHSVVEGSLCAEVPALH